VDGITLEAFPVWVKEQWEGIRRSLKNGTYCPKPVRGKEIPKPNGAGVRKLGIPTVMDRTLQQAILQVISPLFEPHFAPHSYGFRPGRSGHQAVRQVRKNVKEGYIWTVDLDLYHFFDEADHEEVLRRVRKRVKDKALLKLIQRYLKAGVMEADTWQPTEKGVPQGSPLSPLLSNILLNDLDKELENRGHRWARYADDLVVQVKSARAGERVMESLVKWLKSRLKLTVNQKKSCVAVMSQCGFLGFTVKSGKIRWTGEAEAEFKRRIREITGRSRGLSMAKRLEELQTYMRGWMGYFRISEYYRPLPDMDSWIRRRIRQCYWKQWHKARKRVRELMKLGTRKEEAIQTAMSRKGYWSLSRTLATQTGMTKAWLDQQGVLSLKTLWVTFHYPVKNRM